MKYLLFGLAILMLACGTDSGVVEEPDPVVEDLERVFVVHEIGPTTEADPREPEPPRIVKSNVYPKHERVALNRVRLNEEGIFFHFNEDLHRFVVDLSLNGESLGWIVNAIRPGNNMGFSITLTPPLDGPFLERGKEYVVDLLVGDKTGDVLEMEIQFRTGH